MAEEGQHVEFKCDSIEPVLWSYNNGPLPPSASVDHTSLRLDNVHKGLQGAYTCVGSVKTGDKFYAEAHLVVICKLLVLAGMLGRPFECVGFPLKKSIMNK